MEPFTRTIDAAKKYVVSSTLDRVDWNAELRLAWNGMDLIPMREGKVAGKHVYADSLSFLRQIGVEVP